MIYEGTRTGHRLCIYCILVVLGSFCQLSRLSEALSSIPAASSLKMPQLCPYHTFARRRTRFADPCLPCLSCIFGMTDTCQSVSPGLRSYLNKMKAYSWVFSCLMASRSCLSAYQSKNTSTGLIQDMTLPEHSGYPRKPFS